jgi:hypothetical protein
VPVVYLEEPSHVRYSITETVTSHIFQQPHGRLQLHNRLRDTNLKLCAQSNQHQTTHPFSQSLLDLYYSPYPTGNAVHNISPTPPRSIPSYNNLPGHVPVRPEDSTRTHCVLESHPLKPVQCVYSPPRRYEPT